MLSKVIPELLLVRNLTRTTGSWLKSTRLLSNAASETQTGGTGGESAAGNGTPAENEQKMKELKDKLAKCEQDMVEFKDKYLRAMAETENTRVRMRKEVDNAKIFGIQSFCKDLLEVADVLNLAIVNTNPNKDQNGAGDQASSTMEKLLSMHRGLVMTESSLLKIFERHGLVRIMPKEGDKFDPNLHEAIFRVPVPDKESGSISVITKTGFKLHERVIRAAQVGVVQ